VRFSDSVGHLVLLVQWFRSFSDFLAFNAALVMMHLPVAKSMTWGLISAVATSLAIATTMMKGNHMKKRISQHGTTVQFHYSGNCFTFLELQTHFHFPI
jgi:hypothetical protein